MSRAPGLWRLWIDVGGTFTDCLAVAPAGEVRRAKVLSSGALRGRIAPGEADDATVVWAGEGRSRAGFFVGCQLAAAGGSRTVVASDGRGTLELDETWPWGEIEAEIRSPDGPAVLAARLVTGTVHGSALPPCEIRFATTRGTNALLERRGSPPALFTTRGLGDLLEIGTQQRPELFALTVAKPGPLHAWVVEVDERLAADGELVAELGLDEVEEPARAALAAGAESAAVALLHSYRNPAHEERLAAFLAALGFCRVSTSSSLSPRIKLVPRARTAVVDAYLADTIGEALAAIEGQAVSGSLLVMTSAGGLVRAGRYRAKDSLLSGPAAGVVGAVAAGNRSGEQRLLAFDMGGTSTDVARHEGRLDYRAETTVEGITLASPSLAVETVAAGGGSICRFDGRQLKVGPESVGADPGPACYGRGGELSLTDVNLLLGRLAPGYFPFRLDEAAARTALAEVRARHREALGEVDDETLLAGFLRIANEKMAGAVRAISLAAGYRPREHALVTFGGAGPQHACGLAALLGIERVLVPADAALLSAAGLGSARLERIAERQVLAPLEAVARRVGGLFEELAAEAGEELVEEGVPREATAVTRREAFLRLVGQDATLVVDWRDEIDLEGAFLDAYAAHFGYRPQGQAIEVESLRLVAGERLEEKGWGAQVAVPPAAANRRAPEPEAMAVQAMWTSGGWVESPVVERRALAVGQLVAGPALVVEEHSATAVEPGWRAGLDGAGALRLERRGS